MSLLYIVNLIHEPSTYALIFVSLAVVLAFWRRCYLEYSSQSTPWRVRLKVASLG
jgi:hypothetical protein